VEMSRRITDDSSVSLALQRLPAVSSIKNVSMLRLCRNTAFIIWIPRGELGLEHNTNGNKVRMHLLTRAPFLGKVTLRSRHTIGTIDGGVKQKILKAPFSTIERAF
jgi:hypothetical protein